MQIEVTNGGRSVNNTKIAGDMEFLDFDFLWSCLSRKTCDDVDLNIIEMNIYIIRELEEAAFT